MSEPTVNHLSCLRSAKGAMTRVGKDIAVLEALDYEKLDSSRISRIQDSMNRATESFELHLDALTEGPERPEVPYETQRLEHLALYQRHSEALVGLKHKKEAMILMSQLAMALRRIELSTTTGYSPSLNYDMDHVSSLAYRVLEAQATPAARHCEEIVQEGESLSDRLRALQIKRAEYVASIAAPPPPAVAVTPSVAKPSSLKLDLPVFNGHIEKWHAFWSLMSSLFGQHPELTDQAKQAHICKQMGTPECLTKAERAFELCPDYESAVARLRSEYEKPRLLLEHHVKTLTSLDRFHNKRSEILEMADTVEGCISGMKRLKAYTAPQIVATIAIRHMDNDLLTPWGKATEKQKEPPGAEQLVDFLRTHAMSVPDDFKIEPSRPRKQPKPERTVMRVHEYEYYRRERSPSPPLGSGAAMQSAFNAKVKCPCCSDHHSVYACSQFRRMPYQGRRDLARQMDLCYNCLSPSHRANDCRSRNTCRTCNGRHHTLLHEDRSDPPTRAGTVDSCVNVTNGRSTVTTHCSIPRTALVEVLTPRARMYGRAQMDSGAEVSLITRRFASQMGAKRIPNSSSTISGMEGSFVSPYQVSLTLKGRKGEAQDIHFHLVDHLAISASTVNMDEVRALPFLRDLPLADPHYNSGSKVDMLLDMGASLFCSMDNFKRSNDKLLQAEETVYGWTVGGRHHCASHFSLTPHQVLKVVPIKDDLESTLQTLWEREEFPADEEAHDTLEEQALEQFQDSVRREPNGTYSVSLPMKQPPVALGESRKMALNRTINTEKSHARRGEGERYRAALQEYTTLGHAERIPVEEQNSSCQQHFYLPIHSVTKPTSTSTKFRLVFDASAKSSNGVALNDILLSGPSLCTSLSTILIRFRMHKLAMTSDIRKMFRGVQLNPPDRDYHRFFLRDDQGRMEEWRMTRVTFGVTSSPFLATRVLREVADEYQQEYPEAARAIRESFYVDDCLVGTEDLASAKRLREDINAVLGHANLLVCKWRTNSQDLTETIPEPLRESGEPEPLGDPTLYNKTLGIYWDELKDRFHVATPLNTECRVPTKKTLLSAMARIYDVLGWYAPTLLIAKLMMQEAWKLDLQWDDKLPDELASRVIHWCSQLDAITRNSISRCYHHTDRDLQAMELHAFADASTKGYGGVIYVRSLYSDLSTSVSLIMSRSKVVPLKKPPSVPRLELNAALIAARIMQYVQTVLQVDSSSTYCWSDSSAVIGWINQDPSKLELYVGNRIRKLTELTEPQSWRYVNTEENPADCLSRGVTPGELLKHPLWWHGPTWLSHESTKWPRRPDINLSRELPEVHAISRAQSTPPELGFRLDSFVRLVRVMAWVWRFVRRTREPSGTRTEIDSHLTLLELRLARTNVLKVSQRVYFGTELDSLARKHSIHKHSKLVAFAPFVDKEGLLRVGGRLQGASLTYDATHPIILSAQSHSVLLLLRQLHLDTVHAGTQTMMAVLSQTYSILGVRRVLRKISRECIVCREVNARTTHQLMGQLPESRVTLTRPFTTVGVDFAGPFQIKAGSVRRPTLNKAYICVYVCYSTKAVHLEVVSDLSTEAFLGSLTRFVARRGCPSEVHSDNGTNFVGAANELQEIRQLLRQTSTQTAITLWATPRLINWHFNPPRAPHFGGLWEAAVGSMKKALRKIMQDVKLNFEELTTVVTQVEAMLNSRPLVPSDSLPDENVPILTAGHFLIGAPLASMPSLVDSESNISLVKRWNLTQRLSYDLWNRWSSEYLSQLQQRNKWRNVKRPVAVGDLVLIRDESTFSRQWPKGRISKLYPGPDGLTRAVDVQTSKGIFRRAITRLCPLIEASETNLRRGSMSGPPALPGTETEQND